MKDYLEDWNRVQDAPQDTQLRLVSRLWGLKQTFNPVFPFNIRAICITKQLTTKVKSIKELKEKNLKFYVS